LASVLVLLDVVDLQ